MDTGICSTRAGELDPLSCHFLPDVHEDLLYRQPVMLHLPAAIGGSIIFDDDLDVFHMTHIPKLYESGHEYSKYHDKGGNVGIQVPCMKLQFMHPCPIFSAPVTPSLHGNGQFIGSTKGTDKQWDQNGDQIFCPLQ